MTHTQEQIAALVKRLRVANGYVAPDFATPIAEPIKLEAANMLEQLAEERAEPAGVLQIDSAPKDHTLIRLLVDYTEAEHWHPLDDAMTAWTIGFNGFSDTGIDEWQFVGWNWEQDVFVDLIQPTGGRVIGWMPLAALEPARTYSDGLEDAANDLWRKHVQHMTSKGRNPEDYSSHFSLAHDAIRAMKEKDND